MSSWEVGAKVLARWSGDEHFYRGVVASKDGDSAYHIHFDDGEKETVLAKDLRTASHTSEDGASQDGSATDESYKKSLQKFAVRRSTRARRSVKTYLEENSEVQAEGSSGESDASEGSAASESSGSDDEYSEGGKRRRKRKRRESPVLTKQRWNPSRRVKADKPATLYESSEDDDAFEDDVELAEKEKSRVEAIVAHRLKEEGSEEVEYLVKLRDLSYLHVKWVTQDEIVDDVNGAMRLKKFRNESEEPQVETRRSRVDYFDQTFVEVERIVDATPALRTRLLKTWKNQASKMLSKLIHARKKGVKVAAFFLEAVDEEKDNAPGYLDIVKEPMDLGTVRSKLQESRYPSFEAFASDVKLVFSNCQLYNEDSDTWIRECCDHLQAMFQKLESRYLEAKAAEAGEGSDSDEELEYFVKWRGLSYADCSWEKESDIHAEEPIAHFQKRLTREKFPAKSSKSSFKKYDESRAYKNDLKLRSYQVEGLNWLAFNYTQNRGCILADEMGLGKTVQVISFVEHLFRVEEVRKPALVVAPLSTLHHWRNECESWTDLNCILYHDLGNKEMNGAQAREFIRDHEFYQSKSSKSKKRQTKFDLLITSYEVLVADAGVLSSIPFSVVVTDEGQRLKSKTSKLVTTFEAYIKSDMRVVLSGTPLQNNISELWALLNFVEPDGFPSEEEFVEKFGNLRNAKQVAQLQKKLKPYMLRRLKETVEKDIPAKEETVIDVELTIMQKKYYRAVFERNRDFLRTGDNVSPQLISIEMELRKCCNHPFLLKGVEHKELAGIPFYTDAGLEQFIHASGKLVFLDKLLAKLHSEKRKVLIFSQFKIMLDLIEDYCKHTSRRYPVERIDGNVAGDMRQRAIDKFSDPNENCFVFLLSTRAGGVGINLVAADTVVLFDSDWNPQNDLQAMARCHRIGQKKNVMVYRLVTRQTYESSLFERAARKLGLEQAVLGVRDGVQASAKEVETLLRHGAYQLMEDDEASLERIKEYCESNIDDLLNRSNKIVWNKSKADSAGGISFSKASFVAKETGQEIEISDPKFWTKLLGEDARTTLLVRLNDGSAYASEVKRFAFFDELRKGGNAIMAEKLTGNPRPDYEDIISNALMQITTMTEVFTEAERVAAAEFLKLIQRPSRRNKATHRFYPAERLMDAAPVEKIEDKRDTKDSDVEENGKKPKKKKAPKPKLRPKPKKPQYSIINGKAIMPDDLKKHVEELGGYESVVREKAWYKIRGKLELQGVNVGHKLHKVYKKYFDPPAVEKLPKPVPKPVATSGAKRKESKKVQSKLTFDGKVKRMKKESSSLGSKKSAKKRKHSTASTESGKKKKDKKKKKKKKKKRSKSKGNDAELLDPALYVILSKKGEPWCRYCGAIDTSGWSNGPWGPKRLCVAHYVKWKKGGLELPGEEPKQPLRPLENTQFKYIAYKHSKMRERIETERRVKSIASSSSQPQKKLKATR